mgnify:CR=1 FL=1
MNAKWIIYSIFVLGGLVDAGLINWISSMKEKEV